MSVSSAGEFKLDPFDRKDVGDPIGQMIGADTVIGDASGGEMLVTFTLPQQFAYIVLGMSIFTNTGSDAVHHYRLSTGQRVNAVDERYERSITAPSSLSLEGSTFVPPKFVTLPGVPTVPNLRMNTVNILGDLLLASFRALVFDRHTVIAVPSTVWRDWVT